MRPLQNLARLDRSNHLLALARDGKRQSSAIEGIAVWFVVIVLVILGQILSRGAVRLIFPRRFQSMASPIVEDAAGFLPVYLSLFVWLRFSVKRPFRTLGLQTPGAVRHILVGAIIAGSMIAVTAGLAMIPGTVFVPGSQTSILVAFAIGLLSLISYVVQGTGEEVLFRGYGFQLLLAAFGPYATVIPIGILFGLLHNANPNASWFGLINTAGFGVLFGYAYVRSRDLWLPIGLHFGWNFTLPLFGVNLSGLRMKVTGYEMSWTAGALWSGGEYGPEASILTSAVVLALFAYLWKAPIRRQFSPIADPPAESTLCEPSPSPPSLPL